jgi:GNAT superfamily N-acetyltransferase
MRVDTVPPEATHDLRRRVLRGGRADSDVDFPQDRAEGAFHLAAFSPDDDSTIVAVASFFPEPVPERPGARAWRLRGMAVDDAWQGRGVGTALLEDAVRRLRADGVSVLWAHGRDSALGFYERHGWAVVGDGFLTPDTQLPHHVVIFDVP